MHRLRTFLPLHHCIKTKAPKVFRHSKLFTQPLNLQSLRRYSIKTNLELYACTTEIEKNPNDASLYLKRGNIHLDAHQIEQAIMDFTKCIELDPNLSSDAYFKRGICQERFGKFADCVKDFSIAIRMNPNEWLYYMFRGTSYAMLGQLELAESDFSSSIALMKFDPDLFAYRAFVRAQLNYFQEALEDCDEVLKLKEDYTFTYFNPHLTIKQLKEMILNTLDEQGHKEYTTFTSAQNLISEGKFEDAVDKLDEVLKVNGMNSNAYHLRGVVYSHLMEYSSALQDYSKSIELGNTKALYSRSNLFIQQREYERALEDLNKYLEREKKDVEAYMKRGHVYEQLQKYKEAIKDYVKVLELMKLYTYVPQQFIQMIFGGTTNYEEYMNSGDDVMALLYNIRSRCHLCMGKRDVALEDIEKSIQIKPTIENLSIRGLINSRLKKYDEAISDYTKAIKLDPMEQYLYNLRGSVYSEMKNYDKALRDYNKAITIDGNNAESFCNRGLAYLKLNEFEEAKLDFDKAIKLMKYSKQQQKNASPFYWRGYIAKKEGDLEFAKKCYFEAINIDPSLETNFNYIANEIPKDK